MRMTKKELDEYLNADPFQPIRINTSDGKSYEIHNPRMAMPMESRLFLVTGKDDWRMIVLRHIASVETIRAA